MSIMSKPFYWIECDVPGCMTRCPDDDYEVSAWGSRDDALTVAILSDWKTLGESHYCFEHSHFVCSECLDDLSDFANTGEPLCERCYEEASDG